MNDLADAYLDKARQSLSEARAVAEIGFSGAAGRAAYLAAFHAAQAFILVRANKVAKTHAGVRSEFARIARNEPELERGLASFLGQAYNLKTIADYTVGAGVGVSASEASNAINGAARFVEVIERILSERA
jgi:uncharacterized protein (UPF0332 family)